MHYANDFNTKVTPVTSPIPDSNQVLNNTGGFVWAITPLQRLKRFLILGNEGGTYYQSQKKLTIENATNVIACIKQAGKISVDTIVEVSVKKLAPKNDAAIFALALATKFGDDLTRRYAFDNMHRVCRTGTHLFQFIEARKSFAGTGRGFQRAVSQWFTEKAVDKLALQVVKYRQRGGWKHRDALRLAHGSYPADAAIQDVLSWTVGKNLNPQNSLIRAYEAAQSLSGEALAAHIFHNKLTREMIPTEHLNKPEIQWALLQNTPMNALVRNLGNMGKSGLLMPMSAAESMVVAKLKEVQGSGLHPFQILLAMKTYASGKGFRGDGSWLVCPKVVDALDDAFYESFQYIEGSSGKRILIGLDVSGSMTSMINDSNISSREASAAMCMSIVKTEPNVYVNGFSNTFVPLAITAKMRLDDVCKLVDRLPFASTDCSLPMIHALENKIPVDMFVVMTDNEVNYGRMHPKQALDVYRRASGINAKLVVCAFTASGFSIADPSDAGMLDCEGLSSDLPSVVREFSTL